MTFKEIAECVGGTYTYDGEDFTVGSVGFDSRGDMNGALFIAFVTDKDDGHGYVSVAANKGAVAALVSKDAIAGIPLIKVGDTKKAYLDIARHYRNKFALPVIAVTGKCGKTTVKDMLKAVLSAKYSVLATEKNLNNDLGVPQTLLKLNPDHTAAVIEMADPELADIVKPDITVIAGDAGDLRASDISQFWNGGNEYGLNFTVHYQEREYAAFLPVLGRHNAQNALSALAAGIKLGVAIEDGIDALRNYPRSSMRTETATVHGVRFIRDYYGTCDQSALAALDTLAELGKPGARVAVLGGSREQLAEYAAGRADRAFYAGNYADKNGLNAALCEAVRKGEIAAGDTVLIAGSPEHKMWEQYELLSRLAERGSAVPAQTRLLVDVDALKHNYAAIKAYVGEKVRVMPVVKADAYGTGAELLANIYSDCDFFAVADLREADDLHAVTPRARFLVVYQSLPKEAERIAERSDYVVMSVGDADFARALNAAAVKAGKVLTIHIEVDTGMSRLGVFAENVAELAKVVADCENLAVEGIFTHYSSADMYAPADLEYTAMQTRRFKEAVAAAESILGEIKYKHAAASAGIFNPEAELFNMVRPGYILRGYYPCEEIKPKIALKPALKYASQITQIKEFEQNASISYGRRFVTARKTLVAEVPVGYSDGVMRKLSNKGALVIRGQLAPIIGSVTMDYTMADVTDIVPAAKVGDDAYIFDNVNMTVERIAELCETIGYEIITNIKDKADKIEVF